MKLVSSRALLVAWAALAPALPAAAQKPLKVHISADMEGVVASVTEAQASATGFEYAQARERMTQEVLAAIAGVRAAGASEIVVADSHGNGQSLLPEKLPQGVTLVRSWPRPLGMMEGVDAACDAALFVGYHASSTNPRGVLAHTYTGAFTDVRLNGVPVTEAALNAAIAGQFGVPVVMISGDDAAVEEARGLLGDLEGAVVKWSVSFNAARTLVPEDAYTLIRQKAQRGLERRAQLRPWVLETPVQLELQLRRAQAAELFAYLPSVARTGSHGIRFTGKDVVEVSRFLEFAAAALDGLGK